MCTTQYRVHTQFQKTMNRKTISTNANIIWHLLCESSEEMSVLELHEASGIAIEDIYTAIGWLARENKVTFESKDDVVDYYVSQRFYF